MKITQVFTDDKFVDSAILSFVDNENFTFNNLVVSESENLKYVKSKNVKIYSASAFESAFSKIDIESDAIFFHCLTLNARKIINNHNQKTAKYCWFLWGFEYYNCWPIENIKLLTTVKNTPLVNKLKDSVVYNDLTYRFLSSYEMFKSILKKYYPSELIDAIQKIDYLAPVLPNEFERIKKLNQNLKYLPFTYGNLESYIGDHSSVDLMNKNNILLGNSADPSNNHLEIIEKLSQIDLGKRKIITPLSYSGNEHYKQKVIQFGYEKLGDNFYPLLDFMSLEKYNELIFSCGYVIFNHIRQQAIGNLIVMGYLGAKIFLNEKSITSDFLKNQSIHFRTTKDINSFEINNSLILEEIKENKKRYYDLFSRDSVNTKIKNLLKIISENQYNN